MKLIDDVWEFLNKHHISSTLADVMQESFKCSDEEVMMNLYKYKTHRFSTVLDLYKMMCNATLIEEKELTIFKRVCIVEYEGLQYWIGANNEPYNFTVSTERSLDIVDELNSDFVVTYIYKVGIYTDGAYGSTIMSIRTKIPLEMLSANTRRRCKEASTAMYASYKFSYLNVEKNKQFINDPWIDGFSELQKYMRRTHLQYCKCNFNDFLCSPGMSCSSPANFNSPDIDYCMTDFPVQYSTDDFMSWLYSNLLAGNLMPELFRYLFIYDLSIRQGNIACSPSYYGVHNK